MDVNLKIQKLGRMMLRLDEATAAAFAFSDQVDGSPWSQTFFASCQVIFWRRARRRERVELFLSAPRPPS